MGDCKIPSRADWLFGESLGIDILSDKQQLVKSYIRYMLNQTLEMFEYNGLPETIPQKEIEILHQINASCIWAKKDDKLYVFFGGLGGILDEYYHPTRAIVSNPYLKFNADMEIGKDCIVTFNDKLRYGLLPMFNRYAYLLAETDISIRYACINARIPYLINADDDNTKDSAEKVLKDIWDGNKFGVILNKKMLDKNGMFTSEFGARTNGNIKDLIELRQFIKSSWYMELGIQSNYNMKRESLNSSETTMDESVLLPLIDDMLQERKIGLEKVNAMFGTNITVKLSSSWEKIREEIKNELKKQEMESRMEEKQDSEDYTNNSEKEETNDEIDRND